MMKFDNNFNDQQLSDMSFTKINLKSSWKLFKDKQNKIFGFLNFIRDVKFVQNDIFIRLKSLCDLLKEKPGLMTSHLPRLIVIAC